MHFAIYIVVLVFETAFCQIHIGPIGDPVHGVLCYNCDDGSHTFPSCLANRRLCNVGQVCKVLYGDRGPRMTCQNSYDCANDIDYPLRNCSGGGVEISLNKCEMCCTTDACVNDIAELLRTEFPENLQLICPGTCSEDNIALCLATNHTCPEGQFCQVSKRGTDITGICRNLSNYKYCMESLDANPCDVPMGETAQTNCFMDCCTSNDCLESHFLLPETPVPDTTESQPPQESTTPAEEIIEPTIIIV